MNIVIYITQKINKNWNFVKNCESKILETYKIVLLLGSKEMFLFLVYSYSSSFSKAAKGFYVQYWLEEKIEQKKRFSRIGVIMFPNDW